MPTGLVKRFKRPALLLAVIIAFGAAFFTLRDRLSLESLSQQEENLIRFRDENLVAVVCVAFLVYVIVTGLSLPVATALSLAMGWYLGLWRGVLLISFASTTGATLAFLLSRYLLRDPVQGRFGDRLAAFNRALEREGAFYLFTLRLIPYVPFFVINIVMGLTPMRVWTFWWVSQIGMLPATFVYVWTGSTIPSLQQLTEKGIRGIPPQLLVAFVVLGIFPIAVKRLLERFRTGSHSD